MSSPVSTGFAFFVALLTDLGETSNLRFSANALFCDCRVMIQSMGYCRGVGRWPSNLARPPGAACPTQNPVIAEETPPAIMRFPPDALCCDYRLMENDTGYICEVGRKPSFPAHTPHAACVQRVVRNLDGISQSCCWNALHSACALAENRRLSQWREMIVRDY
jgi:hypothetical protein